MVKDVELGIFGLYFFGDRREIEGAEVAAVGVSTVMAVPPGDSPGRLCVNVVESAIEGKFSVPCHERRL